MRQTIWQALTQVNHRISNRQIEVDLRKDNAKMKQ